MYTFIRTVRTALRLGEVGRWAGFNPFSSCWCCWTHFPRRFRSLVSWWWNMGDLRSQLQEAQPQEERESIFLFLKEKENNKLDLK